MRSQEKSRPGDLNGAPRGQVERGLGNFSSENIVQEVRNVNDENDHATTRKSPMEPAGTSLSTELRHLRDSHMDSMTNSLQNINDETSRITTSMESADTTPSASPGETGRYNTATIADFNGNISLKNISPRREGEIKNLSQQREEISRASDGGANVVPSSTNSDSYVGGAPVSAGRSSDGVNIAQEVRDVNEGNVLAYDISGIRKSTGRGLDGSAISADALDQSIDNSSIPNNPQDVNDENNHITSSWSQQRRTHTP